MHACSNPDAEALTRREAGVITNAALEETETAYGIHANRHGLMADPALRACFQTLRVWTEDWMHGALQDGTLNLALQAFLESMCVKMTWDPELLYRFLASDFKFPGARHKPNLRKIFDSRSRNHMRPNRMKFHCNATELLSLYVLLRHFVYSVVVPVAEEEHVDISAELQAFGAACKVVDIIMLLKHGHAGSEHAAVIVQSLRAAVDASIELHIRAYGDALIKPKHHRMQHVADQILRDGHVLDCFLIERLHVLIKRVLSNIRGETERAVLRGVCVEQSVALRGAVLQGLLGTTRPLLGFPGTLVSASARYLGVQFCKGDFVYRDSAAMGRVQGCADDGHQCFILCEIWLPVPGVVVGKHRMWRRAAGAGGAQAWPAAHVELVVAWYFDGEDVVVLIP